METAGLLKCTAYSAYRYLWKFVDWIFPSKFGGCGRIGFSWCPDCLTQVKIIQGPVCEKCGLPEYKDATCRTCLLSSPPYHSLRSYSEYTEPMRSAIIRMKTYSDYGLGLSLPNYLTSMFKTLQWKIDAVIFVPISKIHINQRGYNQTDLFAYPFSLSIYSPYLPRSLVRIRDTRSQIRLSAMERRTNVEGAFKADPTFVEGKNILIIDDVVTTGSSITACSNALLQAGANSVYGIALARPIIYNPHLIPGGV